MNHPHRRSRIRWLVVLCVAALACGPRAAVEPRSGVDEAVTRYIEGDYQGAVDRLEPIARSAPDDATRREAYTYLGRAYMAMGRNDAAIDAFRLGVEYGDHGPCVDYLELLQRFQEGAPEGLHILEAVTRGELAGAAVRVLGDGAALSPEGPTPLEIVETRGWLPPMPDGDRRPEDPVTHAALYSFVGRVLAQAGLSDHIGDVLPGGYRTAANDDTSVSGSEAINVLERVRALKEKNGR